MVRSTLSSRVAWVALLPFVGYLITGGIIIAENWVSVRDDKEFLGYVDVSGNVSKLVGEMQRERGKTGLYLSRSLNAEELNTQREATSAAYVNLKNNFAKMPESAKASSLAAENALLALRSEISDGSETKVVAPKYTGLISDLLSLHTLMAELTPVQDYAGYLRGISGLEAAREFLGQLRAYVTPILAADKPISKEQTKHIQKLFNSVSGIVNLKALVLSDTTRSALTSLNETSEWKSVAATIDLLLFRADQGNFNIKAKDWFQNASAIVDVLAASIDEETRFLTLSVNQVVSRHTREFWAMLGLFLAITMVSGYLIFRFQIRTVKPLKEITQKLHDISSVTSEFSLQLGDTSNQVSTASAQQSAAIEETAASLTQMSSMLSQTVSHSGAAANTGLEAQSLSHSGGRIMGDMVTAMEGIHEANRLLSGIAKIIDEIVDKTGVINEIAFKTRLLSFNASIEAARAGHHEKGFAVVADEVGNLASMSADAASQIEQLVGQSKEQVAQIIEATSQQVEIGKQIVSQASEAFHKIIDVVDATAKSIDQIEKASKEQQLGIEQVTTAMNQMSTATHSTLEIAGSNTQLSQKLMEQTKTLVYLEENMTHLVLGQSGNSGHGVVHAA